MGFFDISHFPIKPSLSLTTQTIRQSPDSDPPTLLGALRCLYHNSCSKQNITHVQVAAMTSLKPLPSRSYEQLQKRYIAGHEYLTPKTSESPKPHAYPVTNTWSIVSITVTGLTLDPLQSSANPDCFQTSVPVFMTDC